MGMYDFIDVMELQNEDALPAEAVNSMESGLIVR